MLYYSNLTISVSQNGFAIDNMYGVENETFTEIVGKLLFMTSTET